MAAWPSSWPRVWIATSSSRSIVVAGRSLAASSASTASASSYARSAESPAAISARAIRPFENGRPSSPPSGSGWR